MHWSKPGLKIFLVFFLFFAMMTVGRADANTFARPGDTVNVNGTAASGDWVSVRAIDQDGSILYFNAVTADSSGCYSDSFVVPDQCTGTLEMSAGLGEVAVPVTVAVTPAPSNGSGDSGGTGGPSSSGGSTSAPAAPEKKTPTPKPLIPEHDMESPLPPDIATHWAKSSITKLIQAGIMAGYPDGTFQPDRKISRAEFAVITVKALGIKTAPGPVYGDCKGHWAKDYISVASANGVISGYSQNTFGPDDTITREQAAVIVARAGKLSTSAPITTFSDSSRISPWASASLSAAIQDGFFKGYSDGSLQPQRSLTRAEAAVLIVKLMNKGH
ncbi:MAG: S-layer homology domain-containing protein [Deltaproteobacteria bacterium]